MEHELSSKDFDVYIKAYNAGYVVAKYEPELAEQIANSKNDHTWFEGFRGGREQQMLEQVKAYRPNFLVDRFNMTDPNMKDRGKDREPNR